MMPKKKPYFPNNWYKIKDAPDDAFYDPDLGPLSFEEFMEWKVAGWELPSSVCCIIRVTNNKTKKVKELVYSSPYAALRKIDKLMTSDKHEFTVVDEESIRHLTAKQDK